jgi:hypothetical protein
MGAAEPFIGGPELEFGEFGFSLRRSIVLNNWSMFTPLTFVAGAMLITP